MLALVALVLLLVGLVSLVWLVSATVLYAARLDAFRAPSWALPTFRRLRRFVPAAFVAEEVGAALALLVEPDKPDRIGFVILTAFWAWGLHESWGLRDVDHDDEDVRVKR